MVTNTKPMPQHESFYSTDQHALLQGKCATAWNPHHTKGHRKSGSALLRCEAAGSTASRPARRPVNNGLWSWDIAAKSAGGQAAHLLALHNVARAIRAQGVKAQPRELVVAEPFKGLLDEGC